MRARSGKILHSHSAATESWIYPSGEIAGRESPSAAASRSLMEVTGYNIPAHALILEGIEADPNGRKKHVFSVSAGAGRQSGLPVSPITWRLQELADKPPDSAAAQPQQKAAEVALAPSAAPAGSDQPIEKVSTSRFGEWLQKRVEVK